ncbi:hypothetical protein like AT4G16640 [Hibiscus trionum]|uniref:Peptidase metallopeptidase domain-containing protein n=1 Tax=Hibiscus trionum TaxID=183268 RepID=A0A9W7IMY1_HIBTR|nr:hypothetical protein like AT4G16640 [Hibiscus trionum]
MADKFFTQLFGAFLMFFVLQPFVIKSLEFESVQNPEGAQKGDVNGLNQIKKYLHSYGYYHHDTEDTFDDRFDDSLESALKAYQDYLGIDVTGKIDSDTIKGVLTPRCGVPDHLVSNYRFNGGKWTKRSLSWSVKNSVNVFTPDEMTPALTAAFKSWADVSPLKFANAGKGKKGDITIGFFPRDHGDGYPFKAEEFAHAFPPKDGRLHYNAKWDWTFDPTKKGENNKIDVQSVGVHEIGHTLGLSHSSDTSAVMYPYYNPGSIKRDLTDDDKKGIKALYRN